MLGPTSAPPEHGHNCTWSDIASVEQGPSLRLPYPPTQLHRHRLGREVTLRSRGSGSKTSNRGLGRFRTGSSGRACRFDLVSMIRLVDPLLAICGKFASRNTSATPVLGCAPENGQPRNECAHSTASSIPSCLKTSTTSPMCVSRSTTGVSGCASARVPSSERHAALLTGPVAGVLSASANCATASGAP